MPLTAASAAAELARRGPPPGRETLFAYVLAHLRHRPDGLSRDCRPDHVTASALVVSPDRRRVLLTLHRKLGLWLQFGGHCESDDADLATAALREAREESGIDDLTFGVAGPVDLDRHVVDCHGDGDVCCHLDVQYLLVAPAGAEPRTSAESVDVAWFDATALPEPTDDSVRHLVGLRRLG